MQIKDIESNVGIVKRLRDAADTALTALFRQRHLSEQNAHANLAMPAASKSEAAIVALRKAMADSDKLVASDAELAATTMQKFLDPRSQNRKAAAR